MKKSSQKKQKKSLNEKSNYWDDIERKKEISSQVYPHLGEVSFTAFLSKIVTGLFLSFIPALIFYILSGGNLFYTWGISAMFVSGLYFVVAGWRDMSRTSARKSYKIYRERAELTKDTDLKFKFNLGFLQFGKVQEDLGAAICLFAIGTLILTL